jgi:dTDP-glucose pyrophosphorylase
MNRDIKPFLVPGSLTIMEAMQQLESTERRILFVVDPRDRLVGSLSDGDIRRYILDVCDLNGPVIDACNRAPCTTTSRHDLQKIRNQMIHRRITAIPVIDSDRTVIDLIFWDDLFKAEDGKAASEAIAMPVVIMAGGKGTRLDPFTRVLPKPLLPIGEKTIIEIIIDSFLAHTVDHFYLSINHKSRIIKSYFEELEPPYTIEYIEETEPLGTAGSLKYLEGKITDSFIVTNCDIIVKANYRDIVELHRKNDNDITLVASAKDFRIPYGVCEIENGGFLKRLTEKPRYNYLVNTGMYVLNSRVLRRIPRDTFFHITELIGSVIGDRGKVGVYPISDSAWIDTGEWSEYKRAVEKLGN